MDGTGTPAPALAAAAARARRLYELGAFERARGLIADLPADEPDALLLRGDFHMYVGELAEALAAYARAGELAPASVHALRGEAAALVLLDRPDAALEAAHSAAALLDLAEEAGGLAHERANVLTAIACAQGLLAREGGLFAKLRHGPAVRAGLERAIALDPDNPYARTGLGRYFLQAPTMLGHDPVRARAELERALARAPFYYLTHAWYIHALDATRATAEAERQRTLYRERFARYPVALAELTAPV